MKQKMKVSIGKIGLIRVYYNVNFSTTERLQHVPPKR